MNENNDIQYNSGGMIFLQALDILISIKIF
jgi:hypothetical protein